MQIRVSEEINNLLDDATTLSMRRGANYVGIEHVFAVLLSQSTLLPSSVVDKHQRSLITALQLVEKEATQSPTSPPGEVYYTPRCAAVSSSAARLAERLHSSNLSAGHLLLAILIDDDAAPSYALDTLQLGRSEIVNDLRKALSRTGAPPEKVSDIAGAKAAATQAIAPGQVQAKTDEDGEAKVSLETLTTDYTNAANENRLEAAIGRDQTILEVMEILSRKTKNNVILVGEAGVGKTKIVEGLAVSGVQGKLGGLLKGQRILELSIGSLMSGTKYRGELEERLTRIIDQLKASKEIILFIDEIHLIMGAGSTDEGGVDIANLLKPVLARGEIRCIGATTFQEYRKFIENDPAIERRFQMVRVEPLSERATYDVLKKLQPSLEKHHKVRVGRNAMKASIVLTKRYMPNRHLPDKAIDVLDQACARFRLKLIAAKEGWEYSMTGINPDSDNNEVTVHEIRKVISQIAGIPLEELTAAERMQLDDLDERLKARIIGQDEAVTRAVAAVKKARVGLADPNRPDATMLFLGPSGVGKTQLAKELSKALFGSANHLITFDMSEYIEEHSVSRLLGAPPGYKGSDEEGRLVSAVRRAPFSILLFDEIEKAHPRIFDVFLPVLEEGRLKDSRGRDVSFRNCIILMTSNVGAKHLLEDEPSNGTEDLFEELTKHFRPEFINRIDEIVPFYPLVFEDLRTILRYYIDDLRRRLMDKDIGIRMYNRAYEHLVEIGYNRKHGARELRRAVERFVANPISEALVKGAFQRGEMIDVLMEDGKLVFRKGEPGSKKGAVSA